MAVNFIDVGRLGKDAEVRATPSGRYVTHFSLAVDSGYGDHKQTLWFDCSCWGDHWQKVCQYLTKGAQILVQGELGTRDYQGKTYLTLNVRDIKLTGSRNSTGAQGRTEKESQQPTQPGAGGQATFDDDIPF